jgi:uncharacterized membrane protein YdbT with pleckstrin-like domain
MSFTLRANEVVIADAKFHWSASLVSIAWALFGTFSVISLANTAKGGGMFLVVALAYGPFLYSFISNRSRRFVVTNLRYYMESGFVSKTLIELPISKINDVSFRQSATQRMFGTGSIVLLTGNNVPTVIKDIEGAPAFREKLAEAATKSA